MQYTVRCRQQLARHAEALRTRIFKAGYEVMRGEHYRNPSCKKRFQGRPVSVLRMLTASEEWFPRRKDRANLGRMYTPFSGCRLTKVTQARLQTLLADWGYVLDLMLEDRRPRGPN